jgi:hypothetical protein
MVGGLVMVSYHLVDPHVLRFEALDTDFTAQLERALATPCDYGLRGRMAPEN